MKKSLAVLLFVGLLCLCACSVPLKSVAFEPLKSFSADITGTHGEFAFAGTLTVNSEQDITLCFSAPEGIAGFKLTLGDGGFYADVLGVEDFTPLEELPDDSLVKLLLCAVRQAVFYQRDFVSQTNKEKIASFTQCGKQMSANYDADGTLTRLACKEATLTCEIHH